MNANASPAADWYAIDSPASTNSMHSGYDPHGLSPNVTSIIRSRISAESVDSATAADNAIRLAQSYDCGANRRSTRSGANAVSLVSKSDDDWLDGAVNVIPSSTFGSEGSTSSANAAPAIPSAPYIAVGSTPAPSSPCTIAPPSAKEITTYASAPEDTIASTTESNVPASGS